jgi:hypothetical protein
MIEEYVFGTAQRNTTYFNFIILPFLYCNEMQYRSFDNPWHQRLGRVASIPMSKQDMRFSKSLCSAPEPDLAPW